MLGYIEGLEAKLIRVETTLGQGMAEPKILIRNRVQLPVLRSLKSEVKEEMKRELRDTEVFLFDSGCQLSSMCCLGF